MVSQILGKASNDLVKLTKHLNFPITNTLMGLGVYPATDKHFMGRTMALLPL